MSAIWPSFWTWVNCAVCARNWVESAGLLGSWYFSWATSSFRNVSWSATDLLLPASVVVLLVYSDVPDVGTSKSLLTKPLIGELMRSSRSVAVHVGHGVDAVPLSWSSAGSRIHLALPRNRTRTFRRVHIRGRSCLR